MRRASTVEFDEVCQRWVVRAWRPQSRVRRVLQWLTGRPFGEVLYLRVQEAALPRPSWQIANTRSLLGAALSGQERFGPAEEVLLSAFDQLRDDPDASSECVHETIERLVNPVERVRLLTHPDREKPSRRKSDDRMIGLPSNPLTQTAWDQLADACGFL